MPNPWVIVGMLALAIGAYFYGHDQGGKEVLAQWNAEKAVANAQAAKVLDEERTKAAAKERAQAANFRVAEARLLRETKKVQDEKAALMATARTDGLFINVEPTACSDSGSPVSGAASGSGDSDGRTRARLPDSVAEGLIQLAADADEVVVQLQTCQQILKAERSDDATK